jgi:hypothetical protein
MAVGNLHCIGFERQRGNGEKGWRWCDVAILGDKERRARSLEEGSVTAGIRWQLVAVLSHWFS